MGCFNIDYSLLLGLTVEKTRRGERLGRFVFLHIRDRIFSSVSVVPPDLLTNGADEG